ncbi:MAG: Sensor histidine kinase RcsC [Legionellaceae bacterium]
MIKNAKLIYENYANILGLIFDHLNINFFAIDRNGYYIAKNGKLSEIVGETDRADKVEENAWNSCLKVMYTGNSETLEEEYQGKWYLSFKSPLYENDVIIGVMGVSFDITEKKEVQKRLQLINQANYHFVAKMSHDIRGALSPTIGYFNSLFVPELSAIFQDIPLTEEKKAAIQNLLSNVSEYTEQLNKPMQKLENLKNLMELKYNKFETFKTDITIEELLFCVNQIDIDKKVKLIVQISEDCPRLLLINDAMVRDVLTILVGNAARFTEKGSITIDVTNSQDTENLLILSVKDTGCGISENRLGNLFKTILFAENYNPGEDSYAGNPTYKLPIVKQILDILGGTINIKSKLGEGTEIIFTLPYENPTMKLEDYINSRQNNPVIAPNFLKKPKTDIKIPPYHVLLLEDDVLTLNIQKKFMEMCGCSVVGVTTEEEALEEIEKETFDIIFIDITLQDSSGLTFARKVQERFGESMTMYAITSHSTEKDKMRFDDYGITDLLKKPVTLKDIKELLVSHTLAMADES